MGRPPKVSPQVAGPASICNAITDIIIADTPKDVNLFFSDNYILCRVFLFYTYFTKLLFLAVQTSAYLILDRYIILSTIAITASPRALDLASASSRDAPLMP